MPAFAACGGHWDRCAADVANLADHALPGEAGPAARIAPNLRLRQLVFAQKPEHQVDAFRRLLNLQEVSRIRQEIVVDAGD